MKYLKKAKETTLITSIIYLLLGLFMIIFPEIVSNSISYVIGALILFFGLTKMISYFNLEYKNFFTGFLLFISLAAIILGIYIIFAPETFISMIPFMIGLVIIVNGIQKISQAFYIKKFQETNVTPLFIYAAILIVLGVLLISNPFGAIQIVIRIIGIFLVIDSIEEYWTMKKYEKIWKDIKKETKEKIKIIDEKK